MDRPLHYFLNGVARQSEDALNRAERINSLLTRWREGLGGSSAQTARDLVNLLCGNPFITARGAEEKLKVAYNTAVRAIIHGVISLRGETRITRISTN